MAAQRTLNDYTDELQQIFDKISVNNKYKIIGSANLKAIRFRSDYDLNENLPKPNFKELVKKFKSIFINTLENPSLYITDFKAGEFNNKPLRWNYEDILKEKNKNISLEDALKMPTTIKLDLIAIVDNKITEISNNYFINQKQDTPIKSLKQDIHELKKENNYFKALKREFSLNEINNKSNTKLLKYFNSDVGLANKVKSDILTLIALIEQKFKPISLKIIRHNIQLIKYELSGVSQLDISKVFDDMMKLSKKKLLVKLNQVANDIAELVNDDAKINYQKLTR